MSSRLTHALDPQPPVPAEDGLGLALQHPSPCPVYIIRSNALLHAGSPIVPLVSFPAGRSPNCLYGMVFQVYSSQGPFYQDLMLRNPAVGTMALLFRNLCGLHGPPHQTTVCTQFLFYLIRFVPGFPAGNCHPWIPYLECYFKPDRSGQAFVSKA